MAELVLSVPLLAGTSGTAKAGVAFSRQKESEFICMAVYLGMLMSVICVLLLKVPVELTILCLLEH